MTLATALWILLAVSSLAAIVGLSGVSREELDQHRRRVRDAPRTLRESSDVVFAAGVGLGTVAALAVLSGLAAVMSRMS